MIFEVSENNIKILDLLFSEKLQITSTHFEDRMHSPVGELGIFTDRDQRSIFLGFEFRESVFFWVLVTAAVFFLGC